MKKRHHSSMSRHSRPGGINYHSLGEEKYDREPMTDSHHDMAAASYRGDKMISEDHRAIANLPQEVMIKAYPAMPGYMPEGLDDTINGVDHQMEGDHKAADAGKRPLKF